mmetsp:Transcript_8944/g.19115  ORF Transcript_8944/g.19115 Transcript_8944/m.19115 type:complete len:247 (-) Transcript_8944:832-1572(-)
MYPLDIPTAFLQKVDGLASTQDLVGQLAAEEGRQVCFIDHVAVPPQVPVLLLSHCCVDAGVSHRLYEELPMGVLQHTLKHPLADHAKQWHAHRIEDAGDVRADEGVAVAGELVHRSCQGAAREAVRAVHQLGQQAHAAQGLAQPHVQAAQGEVGACGLSITTWHWDGLVALRLQHRHEAVEVIELLGEGGTQRLVHGAQLVTAARNVLLHLPEQVAQLREARDEHAVHTRYVSLRGDAEAAITPAL